MRLPVLTVLAAGLVLAASASGGSPTGVAAGHVRYHEPSQGWTADLPAGWTSAGVGAVFVRSNPVADPTRLLLRTYRDRRPEWALRELRWTEGITVTGRHGARAGEVLRWQRFRGRVAGSPALSAEVAVAADGPNTEVAALVARRPELERLARTAMLPALDSFVPGSPDRPRSVLASVPGEPSYWPTAGWHTASAASQGMDGRRLEAMVAEIRAARLPID